VQLAAADPGGGARALGGLGEPERRTLGTARAQELGAREEARCGGGRSERLGAELAAPGSAAQARGRQAGGTAAALQADPRQATRRWAGARRARGG
jgi:hypothetical protein